MLLQARYSETADKINESASVTGNLAHSVLGRGGRDQSDERQRATAKPLLALWIGANGNVGNEDSAGSGIGGPGEGVGAGRQQRVQVSKQNHRHFELSAADEREHPVVSHPVLQRALGAGLDYGPVRDRIGERDAQLDDIRAALLQSVQDVQRALHVGMARGYVTDQSAPGVLAERVEATRDGAR